jgi:hypothetical protein
MAGTANILQTVPKERLHTLVVPREHGAWGMMLIPLVTGAAVGLARGGTLVSLLFFTALALLLFWLRTPIESLLGTSPMRAQNPAERAYVLRRVVILGFLSLACLAFLLVPGHYRELPLLGGAVAGAFLLQALLRKLSRETRMASQLVGAAGLTATAPAAYYVATGELGTTAWGLWLANWLFAGNQIHFVQLRIHAVREIGLNNRLRRGAKFLFGHFFLLAALFLAYRLQWLPAAALLAFIPAMFRGIRWFFQSPQPLAVRRLGWTEMVQALVFGTLLVVTVLWMH